MTAPVLEADRRTTVKRTGFSLGRSGGVPYGQVARRRPRRRVAEIMAFSETAMASRAINLIRRGIMRLDYGIQPVKKPESEQESVLLQEAAAQVRAVLDNPNSDDDDFGTFIGQIVEDILIWDAGVWEYVERPDNVNSNDVLALEAVPGYTVSKIRGWDGDPESFRWVQEAQGRRVAVLKDKQIEYLMMRKRSFEPFGISPLETAIEIIDAWLGLSSYQKEVASNAYPAIMVWLGANTDRSEIQAFQHLWQTTLAGRGSPGFFGGFGEELESGAEVRPEVLELKPAGDEGLYLKYQEMLTRVLAYCFDLKPQDFGVERDVNRSQGEISASQSVEEARKPIAEMIAKRINVSTIPRIAEITENDLINELEMFWIGLNPRDDRVEAENHDIYARHNVLKVDEIRADLDKGPLQHGLGQLTPGALQALVEMDPMIMITGIEGLEAEKLNEAYADGGVEKVIRLYSSGVDGR